MNPNGKKIAIIGAGVGGLSAAARLAYRGYGVDVLEKLPERGGRNHLLEDKGFRFDMGPSFVLMPNFFKEVFSDCGEKLEDHLDLQTLNVSYKIFFSNGKKLTVFKDSEQTKEELEKFEPGSSKGYDEFLAKAGNFYKTVAPLLYKCFTPSAALRPPNWPLIFKLDPFVSCWDLAEKYFKTEELCYLFTFEAMFMGVSPFEAPAFYSVIMYSDHVQKIAHPMGGMFQIPLALEKIAKKNGANFHYNNEVTALRPNKDGTWRLSHNGNESEYDQVIVNADYAYTQTQLLKRKIPDLRYSCSVYLIYLGLKEKTRGLDHHNLFFGSDLKKNLNEIFVENTIPSDPSFYIHVPTVTDPSLAPEGKEILYILVPTANLKNVKGNIRDEEKRIKRIVYGKINQVIGKNVEDLTEVEHRFYPEDFIKNYNIQCGAAFGLAHTLLQSAFFRPPNFDPHHKNLFYVGASTQPGGGLPVVIASSKIVSDKIQELDQKEDK